MAGLKGINFASATRSSDKLWTERPHAKNIAARAAWDHFAKLGKVYKMRLAGGKWNAYVDNDIQSADAAQFARP